MPGCFHYIGGRSNGLDSGRSTCLTRDEALFRVQSGREGGELDPRRVLALRRSSISRMVQVPHPWLVVLVLVGFTLFVVSKLAVILYRERISFGTRLMTTPMANMYRLGYWLMVVGILATFL